MQFEKTFDLFMEDIIQSVTPKELKERRKEYPKIKLKLVFDKLFRENKMVKNRDGSYDVNGDVDICRLYLTSLEDLPYKLNKVAGHFDCSDNILTSLKGSPKIVNDDFDCQYNKLTSLEECPKIINGIFNCEVNMLTSLENAPTEVKKDFYCNNNLLVNLIGCPKIINGDFDCGYNMLTSLEGCPKKVNGAFNIRNTSSSYRFTIEAIKDVCKVGGGIFV